MHVLKFIELSKSQFYHIIILLYDNLKIKKFKGIQIY